MLLLAFSETNHCLKITNLLWMAPVVMVSSPTVIYTVVKYFHFRTIVTHIGYICSHSLLHSVPHECISLLLSSIFYWSFQFLEFIKYKYIHNYFNLQPITTTHLLMSRAGAGESYFNILVWIFLLDCTITSRVATTATHFILTLHMCVHKEKESHTDRWTNTKAPRWDVWLTGCFYHVPKRWREGINTEVSLCVCGCVCMCV